MAILRTAMEKLFKDPAYLAHCEKAQLTALRRRAARDLLALIEKTYAGAEGGGRCISAIYLEGLRT